MISKLVSNKVLVVLLAGGLLAAPLRASDDLAWKLQGDLYVHSETALSGIDIHEDTIERVIRKLGKPSSVRITSIAGEEIPVGVYEWQTATCSLKLKALTHEGSIMTRSIISIDVVGSCPHAGIGLSGRGLKLGDSLIDARRIYLLQSYFGTTPSDTSPGPFRWSDWAPTLQVDFDKSGKVNHMKLTWQCVQTCF